MTVLLYEKTTNTTSAIHIDGITLILTTCTLNIGDSTPGFAGTQLDFEIFTGAGVILGMPWVSLQNCPKV